MKRGSRGTNSPQDKVNPTKLRLQAKLKAREHAESSSTPSANMPHSSGSCSSAPLSDAVKPEESKPTCGCTSASIGQCKHGMAPKSSPQKTASADPVNVALKARRPKTPSHPSVDKCPLGMMPDDVRKEIIYGGNFDTKTPPPYPNGTKLQMHYKVTRTTEGETVIDDSRSFPKPVEFLVGKQFKLRIWELALNTMFPGETSKFVVPREMCVFYPVVARILRNSAKPKEEARPFQTGCCANSLTGTGYKDLDELLNKPQRLAFTFELLEVCLPGEYQKEPWYMTDEEKEASYPEIHQAGNALYREGKFEEASAKYLETLSIIEQLINKEVPGSEEVSKLKMSKVPILLNYGICKQKTSDYYEAMNFYNMALEIQPENVKGIFRRGQCYSKTGQWDLSRVDLEKALSLDKTLSKEVKEELNKCDLDEKSHKKEETDRYKRMFLNPHGEDNVEPNKGEEFDPKSGHGASPLDTTSNSKGEESNARSKPAATTGATQTELDLLIPNLAIAVKGTQTERETKRRLSTVATQISDGEVGMEPKDLSMGSGDASTKKRETNPASIKLADLSLKSTPPPK